MHLLGKIVRTTFIYSIALIPTFIVCVLLYAFGDSRGFEAVLNVFIVLLVAIFSRIFLNKILLSRWAFNPKLFAELKATSSFSWRLFLSLVLGFSVLYFLFGDQKGLQAAIGMGLYIAAICMCVYSRVKNSVLIIRATGEVENVR